MWRHVAWIFQACGLCTTMTCPMCPTTMSTALAARRVRGGTAQPLHFVPPMKWALCATFKKPWVARSRWPGARRRATMRRFPKPTNAAGVRPKANSRTGRQNAILMARENPKGTASPSATAQSQSTPSQRKIETIGTIGAYGPHKATPPKRASASGMPTSRANPNRAAPGHRKTMGPP